ncbi:MAG: type IX secretion system membrane protein PorP/SprF [Bacteroidota bacterium]|nr:type IX secretion system membrane protein PorP/SprF [Bacteroidota bacterium]
MKVFRSFTLLFIFLILTGIKAQQIPFYSQYMLNPYIINPAFAGTTELYNIGASYRYQWVGVNDAPSSFYLSGNGHVGKDHPLQRRRHMKQNDWHNGIGFIISSEQTGPIITTNNVMVSYAYDTPLTDDIRLSFGLSAGIQQFMVNGNNAELRDKSIPVSSFSRLLPNGNAGLWLYHNLWFAGVSAQNLFSNKIEDRFFAERTGTNRLVRHYYANVGGVFNLLPDPRIDAIPSIVVKYTETVNLPSFDINIKLKYKEIAWKDKHLFWLGVSYRNEQGLIFLAGGRFNENYEVGYAYDLTLGYLNPVSKGSHEIYVNYRIVPKVRVISPSDYW